MEGKMGISIGTILLYSGIALAVVSAILLIIFLSSERKKKDLFIEEVLEKKDTAVLVHKNENQELTETEFIEEENTETIPLEDDKTEMINS